jgi:hypothetical protein
MYIERGGDVVVASFYYVHSNWTPVFLAGKWSNETVNISVQPENPFAPQEGYDPQAPGRLEAKLTKTGFTGFWTPPNAQTNVPARLAFEATPQCDGTGPLKRFSDPGWPISFNYPDAWHLDDSGVGDYLSFRLICPNAAMMFYESSLNHLAILGYHYEGGKWTHHWMYGDEVDTVGQQQHGMTTVDGDAREWRIYCRGGGYVAQGEGHQRLLITGNRWVNISGDLEYADAVLRIVASARPRKTR